MCDIDLDPDLPDRENYTTAVIAPDISDEENFQGESFDGIFNGNGHIINNLVIDTAGINNDYLGLFGQIVYSESRIFNLGLDNIRIVGGNSSTHLGGICAFNVHGTIEFCYSSGLISSGDDSHNLGGLCGVNQYGTIEHCMSTVNVTGNNVFGGFCGRNIEGVIQDCISTGLITDHETSMNVGGFCGIDMSGNIINCFWDVETSGIADANEFDNVYGKSTSQMKSLSTFENADWEFSNYNTGLLGDWHMPENSYPLIYWRTPGMTTVTVPDVSGMAFFQAFNTLTASGITIDEIIYVNSWSVSENIVTGLSAYIGGMIDASCPLDIYISLGGTGDGTEYNPYNVSCQADLDAINSDLSAHYVLINDILMSYYSDYTTCHYCKRWSNIRRFI